jgi:hypothetical protein
MLRGNVMKLSQNVLSESGRKLLAGGFMCENLYDMWFDKDSILDHLYNEDLGSLLQGEYDNLPEEFWKILGLKEDVYDAIREHVESGGEMLFTEY